jgi:RHS repeat-associated protein
VTSDTGMNLIQTTDYASYGSVIASTNTGTTKAARQFIGQFTDDSGLSYLNARFYNSAQGQFITQDPVFWSTQQNLSDPQSLNSYSYSEDNPIVKEDPSGRKGIDFELFSNNPYIATAEALNDLWILNEYRVANSNTNTKSPQEVQDQTRQAVFDTGLAALGTVVAPEARVGLLIGGAVLGAKDSYCANNACRDLRASQNISAQAILASIPSPNITINLAGGSSPITYNYGGTNGSGTKIPSSSGSGGNTGNQQSSGQTSGGSSGSSANLISLYQSLVSTLTALVSALKSSSGGH